jgi:hypothetical protein
VRIRGKCPYCGNRSVPCVASYSSGSYGLPEYSHPAEGEITEIEDCEECDEGKNWTAEQAEAIEADAWEHFDPVRDTSDYDDEP